MGSPSHAPCGLGTFPPRRSSASGCRSVSRTPGRLSRRASLGVGFLFRALLPRARPHRSPRPRTRRCTDRSQRGTASRGVLALSSALSPGARLRRSSGFPEPRWGGGRQDPASAVLRDLAPLDGFGRVRGTHGLLAEPAARRDAPTLCGLVSCRSRPMELPSELSSSGEPCPISRAFASLRVRLRPLHGAAHVRFFTVAFTHASRPCPGEPGRWTET